MKQVPSDLSAAHCWELECDLIPIRQKSNDFALRSATAKPNASPGFKHVTNLVERYNLAIESL